MAIGVLLVDDSSFFRRQLERIVSKDPRIKVIGTAADGKEAIQKVKELSPSVVVMDVEMPVMNGIEATRRIMRSQPTPILMFSSLTTDGAQATLDALDAGAVDFLPKSFEDISGSRDEAGKVLCERIITIARRSRIGANRKTTAAVAKPKPAVLPASYKSSIPSVGVGAIERAAKGNIDLVAIGTSTGGPVALQKVLTCLPSNFPVPLVLVQHMPGTFTPAFAKRLDGLCEINVKHAEDGDYLQPGNAYLAPGGMQMLVQKRAGKSVLRIEEPKTGQTYKPSVDMTFSSLLGLYQGKVLAVIMTGMGADGCEGCKKLKHEGALVWAQDEATSTVYGMPAAVAAAAVVDRILPLNDIGPEIIKQV
jgi:two-component system chemotaxis response regulator CheB